MLSANGVGMRQLRVFPWMLVGLFLVGTAVSDPFPPDWGGGTGPAVHYAPADWPAEPGGDPLNCQHNCGDWQPYTRFDNSIGDPRVQDPSNGGTSPQNYVNIASSCIDKGLPSIYYNLHKPSSDPDQDVLMFRWRVEQIANTYGTGPNAGSFSATDPWNSALWTVLFDVDGDGFRDLAAHLDGSSGSPSARIDRIAGIWGPIPTQSIDYINDPNIHEIAHNPTGFTSGSVLLNFQNLNTPVTSWPKPQSDEVWDYGTSRSTKIVAAPCNEYFVDYQIPMKMLDASGLGGPKLDRNTPLAMLFCTANSLNNPFQKDCALNKQWAADPEKPGPYGDFCTFNGGCFEQPIIDDIQAQGCGPVNLSATVKDALAVVNGVVVPSIQAVEFWYYHDVDANGLTDDGNAWTKAVDASNVSLNGWAATWNSTPLLQGQYLIGVQTVDDPTLVDDGMPPATFANRTFSYLTQPQVDALGNVPASSGEAWWANPAVTGIKTVELALNGCGVPPPSVSKTVSASTVPAGGTVDFTITVDNSVATPLTLNSITDSLPSGFTFAANNGGTLTPTTSPSAGAGGNISWTFASTIIPGNSSATLIFTANVPAQTGTYSNVASADTNEFGILTSEPVQVSVGEPRLTIAKMANSNSVNPGATVTYTITYSNDSPIDVTGAFISDTLPTGLTFVSANNGGVQAGGTITWTIGDLAAGAGPFNVSFTATVDDPYPGTATIPLVNTATIDSNETAPADASSSIFVNAPRPSLALQKSADKALVDPASGVALERQVVYTLAYANDGNADANNVVLSDTIPAGFTFVAASGGGTESGGVVTWNLSTLTPAQIGSVTVTLEVVDPYTGPNPSLNIATIDSDETDPLVASGEVGVRQTGQLCNNYYPSNTQTNVGFDGLARVANTTVPGGLPFNLQQYIAPGATVTLASFYQDPASDFTIDFNAGASTVGGQIFYTKSNALGGAANANLTLTVDISDYNPADGATTLLGSASYTDNGSPTPPVTLTGAAVTGQLFKGHRLLIEVSVAMQAGKDTTLDLSIDDPGSFVEVCSLPPPNLVLNKRVDTVTAAAGDSLTYTIDYANTGDIDATNVVLTDTLPTGVTFVSSVPLPNSSLGQVHTYNLGTVLAGQSGAVVINAFIDNPLDPSITELINTATISSTETPEVTATATTTIEGSGSSGPPVMVISKSADKTRVRNGEIVTYTINVLNAGGADATNVVVSDTIPAQAYYSYVAASIAGGDSRNDGALPTLQWTINTLAPGASQDLTFWMQVGPGAAPAGSTTRDNFASVVSTETPTPTDSNIVVVTIDANPELTLTKSVTPELPTQIAPGGELTYTLVVKNIGDATATDVRVTDPFPANSVFVRGSQTTTQGTASFDAVGERMVFDVGSLAKGASASLTFKVKAAEPLPHGTTPIDNTATATASNAGSVQASVSSSATAAAALDIDKSGPASVVFPAANLSADVATAPLIYVDDASRLNIGAAVSVSGQIRTIQSIAGNAVTLSSPITASSGDALIQAISYGIAYGNSGNADATGVVLNDTLPGNMVYVSATPAPSSAPLVGNGGTVSWNLGTLAAGATGNAQIVALPTGPGSALNIASIDSNETLPVNDSVTTEVGGLRVHKHTTTPVVAQTVSGTSAHYVIQVFNDLAVQAGPITVTDILTSGFTYATTTGITGQAGGPAASPTVGNPQPDWTGLTIPAGGTLRIEFDVDIAPSVGPATYQNEVLASGDEGISQFDFLATTVEDVTVLVGSTGLVDGVVYEDNDNSGTFSPGDTPLAGVDVTITGSGPNYVATTNASGYFAQVVPAGSTTLDVDDTDLPAGVSLTNNNFNEGTDTTTVNVPAGGSATDNTGYVHAGPSGTITGTVYNDINGSTSQDIGEAGLVGVTVELRDTSNNFITSTLTDASGNYTFLDVPVGDYTVIEINPLGYTSTTPDSVSPVTVTDGGTAIVNFGDQVAAGPVGSVSGVVFNDVNTDTTQNAGEPGIAGVIVELRDLGNVLIATTTTAVGGSYSFLNVPVASYNVVEIQPLGYTSTTPDSVPVAVTDGGNAVANFGEQVSVAPSGSLSGVVYDDLNGSGTRDGGEAGIVGVRVELRDTGGGLVAAVNTLPDGSYIFNSVPPGSYFVLEIDPSGYTSTTSNNVSASVTAGVNSVVNFGDRLPVVNATPVPGMNAWVVLLLSMLLAGFGVRRRA